MTLITAAHAEDGTSELLFPHSVAVEYNNEHMDLYLTGLTIRRKFFLNTYSMAHYIQHNPDFAGDDIYKNILHHKGARQISMKFLRALDAKQIQKSLIFITITGNLAMILY